MIAFFRGWGRHAGALLGVALAIVSVQAAAVEAGLQLESETKDGWFTVVGTKDQALLVERGGRAVPVSQHAKVRVVGDLAANLPFVRIPDTLQIVEVARPSASTDPRSWNAQLSATRAAFFAEGNVPANGATGWIQSDSRAAVIACLWLVDGKVAHTVVRDFAGEGAKAYGLDRATFRLSEAEIRGTGVFIAFSNGVPLPATPRFADESRDRAARLVALGRDVEVAGSLTALGRGAELSHLLTIAARCGADSTVAALLKLGVPQSAKSPLMLRPVDAAVDAARVEITKRLLKAGAPTKAREANGMSPLQRAAGAGNLELCQSLLAAGAKLTEGLDRGTPPLFNALHADRSEVALWLVSKGAKFHPPKERYPAAILARAAGGQLPLVKYLRELGAPADEPIRGETPLLVAAREGHVDVVQFLLDEKAQVDRLDNHGNTPLLAAASRGRAEAVALLLKAGANANHANKKQITPLLAACFSGSEPAIHALLQAGAAVNPPGARPAMTLSLALSAGAGKAVAELLSHGAAVEPRGQFFEDDLQGAFAIDSVEFVAAALAAGMSPERRLPGDWSALEVAELMSARRCADALLAAGAVPREKAQSRLRAISQLEASPRIEKLEAVRDPRNPAESDFRGETVIVDAVIDETGAARFARAVCQDCRLSRAAAETVLSSRFTPGRAGGWPVATRIQVPVRFLDKSELSYDLESLDRRPRPTHQVGPTYPFSMKSRGVQGRVVVEFIVTPEGTVRDPSIMSSTHEDFERHAVMAVLQWRFEPGIKDGVPVSTRMAIPIGFRLED